MNYGNTIDRKHPGCLVFLLDQSYSMLELMPEGGGLSKADAVARVINGMLDTIVRHCTKDLDAPPRHYYDIAVIGYGGAEVGSLLGGDSAGSTLASVEQIANSVIRHDRRDGILSPVWFDPISTGETPMCRAFDLAGRVIHGWTQNHANSFPPIVFNITDGDATDGDPAIWAERLRSLKTDDGNLLLFTIHLSTQVQAPISYPSTEGQIPDDFGRRMFRLTSELPDFMRLSAGRHARPGSRGLVCNATIDAIIHALKVGTSIDYLGGP